MRGRISISTGEHRSGEYKVYGWYERGRHHYYDSSHRRSFWSLRIFQSVMVYCLFAILSLSGSQSGQRQANPVGRNSSYSSSSSDWSSSNLSDWKEIASLRSSSNLRAVHSRIRVHDSSSGDRGVSRPATTAASAPPARPALPPSSPVLESYTCSELEQLWDSVGGNPGEAFIAAEIATAESGGNPDAISPTDDVGLWQVNLSSWGSAMASENPVANARAAVTISDDGTNWGPWTTYTSGAYIGRC